MSNYIFYTPQDLARMLIDLIPEKRKITSVIDICCGSWNLLKAAKQKYPQAHFVGVDVDGASEIHQIDNAEFICQDGRKYAEEQANNGRFFDLILSNPPFGSLSNDEKEYSIKGNVFAESKRYEAEMLWANYRLMSDNSILVIILPATYVDGSAYVSYRKWLAEKCYVHKVIRLPQDTFAKAKLNTVALVLEKKQSLQRTVDTCFYQVTYDSSWNISQIGTLSCSDIDNGSWSNLTAKPLSQAPLKIYRGSISSHFFTNTGKEILHCSSTFSRSRYWKPTLRFCENVSPPQMKYAKNGDIIINRIGRSAGYWCIYREKKRLISDCLIVIPSPSPKTISQINSISSKHKLLVPLRGVSTQYITMEDILNRLSVLNDKEVL